MSTMIRLVACLCTVSAASALGEASQPERLRRCALTWAVTFTAAALKFAAEKQRGWLEDHGYVTAQLVHLGVALSCYAGYFSSK